MSDTLHAALVDAIEDEYRARARYAAAIAAFGPIRPFVPILEAEGRHVAALAGLFARYGFALPPDLWAGRVSPPASVAETCRQGVAAEIANARM